jgi:Glyoxalase/Bleomycin resistance protein/Dioxygenase superfamily
MERIISGLLQDFEAGKLTRRQLIQALALGMTAGPAALAVAQKPVEQSSIPPSRSPAPWKTAWLDYISYAVGDYRRSAAFYRDLMGWEIIHDDGQKQCSMKVGNVGGIIIRNRAGIEQLLTTLPLRVLGIADLEPLYGAGLPIVSHPDR